MLRLHLQQRVYCIPCYLNQSINTCWVSKYMYRNYSCYSSTCFSIYIPYHFPISFVALSMRWCHPNVFLSISIKCGTAPMCATALLWLQRLVGGLVLPLPLHQLVVVPALTTVPSATAYGLSFYIFLFQIHSPTYLQYSPSRI